MIFRHYKGGLYRKLFTAKLSAEHDSEHDPVLFECKLSEDHETAMRAFVAYDMIWVCPVRAHVAWPDETEMVVYVSLTNGEIWVRLASEWAELVTWPDGMQRARFM